MIVGSDEPAFLTHIGADPRQNVHRISKLSSLVAELRYLGSDFESNFTIKVHLGPILTSDLKHLSSATLAIRGQLCPLTSEAVLF